jgi:hypothetical protein
MAVGGARFRGGSQPVEHFSGLSPVPFAHETQRSNELQPESLAARQSHRSVCFGQSSGRRVSTPHIEQVQLDLTQPPGLLHRWLHRASPIEAVESELRDLLEAVGNPGVAQLKRRPVAGGWKASE